MIELKNITKNYEAGGQTVRALRGISVAFRQNEFVAVLGPSGGGKTTLLNIVGGLDRYTSGDLIINGISTKDFNDKDWDGYRNHTIGFVFQTYNLIPHQSVIRNVELALTIAGVGRKERTRRAKEALERVGLGDQLYKRPNQLSGGQMQRVAIARALINDPDVLLADEPTGALDTQSSIQIMDLLKEVASDRLVIMVTHNPDLANAYANRIIRLTDGQIISDTNPYVEESRRDPLSNIGKASMSFLTAFSLSLNNLLTKKGRTILVALAGSIGIIGIALIMSLSNGVNRYIDEVQKNSLSSYPLTIENSDVDMTQTMMSMMGNVTNKNIEEGKVTETSIVADLFNQVGSNNLKAFKRHMEASHNEIDPLLTAVQYKFGVKPEIYKYDTSKEIIKLNPSSLYSGLMTSSLASYTFRDTFQELIDNEQLLREQYEVVAGRWPEKYDEMVLIIYDENTISDYLVYSLGLRNPKDLEDYVNKALSGEKITVNNTPMVFEMQDFLDMKFKLVIAADYYEYDSKFDVWKDMSDDDAYLKKMVDNGIELKISGVICPKDGVSSTVMMPGVGYLPALSDYIREEAGKRLIVRQQLNDPETDVFSRRSFDEVNSDDNKKSNLNFEDMISVDRAKMEKAFGGKVNEEDMKKMISNHVNEALNAISTDTTAALGDLNSTLQKLATEMMMNYITEKGNEGVAFFAMEDIESMVNKEMGSSSAKTSFAQLEKTYGVPSAVYPQLYTPLLNGLLQGYYATYTAQTGQTQAMLAEAAIPMTMQAYLQMPQVTDGLKNMASTMSEAKMKTAVGTSMGTLSSDIIATMASAFKVDPDLLAEAFSFDMDEDELKRLMSSYMSGDNSDATSETNLRKLNYSDKDNPVSISLYFKDFDSKEAFKDFIKAYNDKMEAQNRKENVIVYTDITGIMISSVSTIINAISYVLIAFVSISLVVSSIMIGIITYISVLERTKEIGILRSLGASKGNVANVFNAETFILGLAAGCFGVGLTWLLCIPINAIVRKVTEIPTLTAYLPLNTAGILVVISVVLTIIAGLIPSRMATKCDPVIALRTE